MSAIAFDEMLPRAYDLAQVLEPAFLVPLDPAAARYLADLIEHDVRTGAAYARDYPLDLVAGLGMFLRHAAECHSDGDADSGVAAVAAA
jgi:hypothetical protein